MKHSRASGKIVLTIYEIKKAVRLVLQVSLENVLRCFLISIKRMLEDVI